LTSKLRLEQSSAVNGLMGGLLLAPDGDYIEVRQKTIIGF
jgi:hypothetical protein